MEQTAYFIRWPRRIEELRAEENGRRRPYRIVKTFRMGAMANRAFLENADGCGEEGGLVRCLCVCCPGWESILVLPDGTGHAALAALA